MITDSRNSAPLPSLQQLVDKPPSALLQRVTHFLTVSNLHALRPPAHHRLRLRRTVYYDQLTARRDCEMQQLTLRPHWRMLTVAGASKQALSQATRFSRPAFHTVIANDEKTL